MEIRLHHWIVSHFFPAMGPHSSGKLNRSSLVWFTETLDVRSSGRTPQSPTPHTPMSLACSARETDPILAHAAFAHALATCPRRARRARYARRSLARSRTRASRCGCCPSAYPCPCPCHGPCHRRAPHWRPPLHSVASSSMSASSSGSMSLHLSKQQANAKLKAHVANSMF
jgi:hypothetical protein